MRKESEFLTEEEVSLMLNLPDRRSVEGKRDYAILALFTTTGLRKAELCSLMVSSISTYRNANVIDVEGKGKRKRRLFLNSTCSLAIRDYLKAAKSDSLSENSPLFLTLGKHGPYEVMPLSRKAVDCLVMKYIRKACIRKRITPHSLRHTCLTNMLTNGVDSKTVQEIAGHSSMRTTESIYLHSNDERKLRASWLIGQAYNLGNKSVGIITQKKNLVDRNVA